MPSHTVLRLRQHIDQPFTISEKPVPEPNLNMSTLLVNSCSTLVYSLFVQLRGSKILLIVVFFVNEMIMFGFFGVKLCLQWVFSPFCLLSKVINPGSLNILICTLFKFSYANNSDPIYLFTFRPIYLLVCRVLYIKFYLPTSINLYYIHMYTAK